MVWPIEEKAQHSIERVCVCGGLKGKWLTSFQLRSSKNNEEMSSSVMKRDFKVISKVRTDVVVEDVLDEFASLKAAIFVYAQNRASICWRLSKPRRLQHENNYLLQMAIFGPSKCRRAYCSKLICFVLFLQTLNKSLRKDLFVESVILSLLISSDNLKAMVWKNAAFKLWAFEVERNFLFLDSWGRVIQREILKIMKLGNL